MLEKIKNRFFRLWQVDPNDMLMGAIFCSMLALPVFFLGGNGVSGMMIFYLLLLCQVILLWKRRQKVELRGGPAIFFLLLAGFVVLMGVSIIYSPERYEGVITFGHFLAAAILCLTVYGYNAAREKLVGLSYFVVGLGAVLSLVGLCIFLFSQNYIYLRLNSTFGNHIPFGEFLGYPALISFFLLLFKKWGRRGTVILIFLNSLFFSTFFFNHCRGAWVSVLAVAGTLALFFIRKIDWRRCVLFMGAAAVITAMTVFAVMQIKSFQAAQASAVAIYNSVSENSQSNALTARLAYWSRALEIFKDHPAIGAGIESYRNLYQTYNVPPFYYSADPHNIFLKILAETGVIGILFFAGYVLVLIFACLRLIWAGRLNFDSNDEFTAVKIAFSAAVINSLLNNFFGFGFGYLENIIIFFLFSGIVISLGFRGLDMGNTGQNIRKKNAMMTAGFSVPYVWLLPPALLLFAGGAVVFVSNFYYDRGAYLISRGVDPFWGRQELGRAIEANPINPVYKKMAASWDLVQIENNPAFYGKNAAQAEKLATDALAWSYGADILYLQGKLRLFRGNEQGAIESYTEAVKVDPWEFDSYIELVKIYDRKGSYRDINALLERFLPYWKKEDILSVFSVILDKKSALEKAAYLHYMNSQAYERENNPQKAQEEMARSLDYSQAAKNYRP